MTGARPTIFKLGIHILKFVSVYLTLVPFYMVKIDRNGGCRLGISCYVSEMFGGRATMDSLGKLTRNVS